MTVFVIILFVTGISRQILEVHKNQSYWEYLDADSLVSLTGNLNTFYTAAGNLNIKCGGSVWAEHARFYEVKHDPNLMLPVFTKLYDTCKLSVESK
jgi:hypothetical protein